MKKSPSDPWKQFERDWSRWVRKPTALSPREAAARVSSRLSPRRPPLFFRPLPVAAAVILVIFLGAFLFLTPEKPDPVSFVHLPEYTGLDTPLSDNVVVIWLTPETPLYMGLKSPTQKPGGSS